MLSICSFCLCSFWSASAPFRYSLFVNCVLLSPPIVFFLWRNRAHLWNDRSLGIPSQWQHILFVKCPILAQSILLNVPVALLVLWYLSQYHAILKLSLPSTLSCNKILTSTRTSWPFSVNFKVLCCRPCHSYFWLTSRCCSSSTALGIKKAVIFFILMNCAFSNLPGGLHSLHDLSHSRSGFCRSWCPVASCCSRHMAEFVLSWRKHLGVSSGFR